MMNPRHPLTQLAALFAAPICTDKSNSYLTINRLRSTTTQDRKTKSRRRFSTFKPSGEEQSKDVATTQVTTSQHLYNGNFPHFPNDPQLSYTVHYNRNGTAYPRQKTLMTVKNIMKLIMTVRNSKKNSTDC